MIGFTLFFFRVPGWYEKIEMMRKSDYNLRQGGKE